MPNDCKNDLTIISTCEKDIIEILKELRNEIPNIEIKQNRKLGIRVSFITAWKPHFQFTETPRKPLVPSSCLLYNFM